MALHLSWVKHKLAFKTLYDLAPVRFSNIIKPKHIVPSGHPHNLTFPRCSPPLLVGPTTWKFLLLPTTSCLKPTQVPAPTLELILSSHGVNSSRYTPHLLVIFLHFLVIAYLPVYLQDRAEIPGSQGRIQELTHAVDSVTVCWAVLDGLCTPTYHSL